MKDYSVICIISIFVSVMVCSASDKKIEPIFADTASKKLAWSELVTRCISPEEVCSEVKRHVECMNDDETDNLAECKDSKSTWTQGVGSSKDIANCIASLCNEIGFKARVMLVYYDSRSEGQAVVVGEINGDTWMSRNGSYETVRSLDEVKNTIAYDYCWPISESEIVPADEEPLASEVMPYEVDVGVDRTEYTEDRPRTRTFYLRVRMRARGSYR